MLSIIIKSVLIIISCIILIVFFLCLFIIILSREKKCDHELADNGVCKKCNNYIIYATLED